MLTLRAHAKVNLGLSVLAKRGDGFHELDTLFARLELHDVVGLVPVQSSIRLRVEGADLPQGPDNLAYGAAELYLREAGEVGGVDITLTKHIPVAAGLGGGSSDAAAVLRGLAELYPAGLDLLRLAKALGSDVPFFVGELSAARAGGRGERLEPLELPELHLVLVNPAIPVKAGDAYENLQNFSARLDGSRLVAALERGDEPGYVNALQAGVLRLEPAIREVLSALRGAGLRGVLMSGSGATCFGIAAGESEAKHLASELREARPNWWTVATRTM